MTEIYRLLIQVCKRIKIKPKSFMAVDHRFALDGINTTALLLHEKFVELGVDQLDFANGFAGVLSVINDHVLFIEDSGHGTGSVLLGHW